MAGIVCLPDIKFTEYIYPFFFFCLQGNRKDDRENDDDETELTPTDMAEYLYATQQFAAFYSALERLVNQSKVRVVSFVWASDMYGCTTELTEVKHNRVI